MKKIVTPTNHYRLEGIADKDGVNMVAKIGTDTFAFLGHIVRTTVDENGFPKSEKIEHRYMTNKFDQKIRNLGNRIRPITLIGAVVSFILAIVFMFFSNWACQVAFNMFFVMVAAFILHRGVGVFVAKVFGDKEIKEFTRFNAAKNAVINAYYETGKVPTLEEAKQYSYFNHLNDYVKQSDLAFIILAVSILRFLPDLLYIMSAVLLVVLVNVWNKKNVVKFWQFLVTSKPKDIHYNVAIDALANVVPYFDKVKIMEERKMEEMAPSVEELENALNKCEGCATYDSCEERAKYLELLKDYKD